MLKYLSVIYVTTNTSIFVIELEVYPLILGTSIKASTIRCMQAITKIN